MSHHRNQILPSGPNSTSIQPCYWNYIVLSKVYLLCRNKVKVCFVPDCTQKDIISEDLKSSIAREKKLGTWWIENEKFIFHCEGNEIRPITEEAEEECFLYT